MSAVRKKRTLAQKQAIFEAHDGICHLCGCPILKGETWDLEHVIAFALTRDDTDENLRPAHVKCHAVKTKEDVRNIAKAKRVSAKHSGARREVRNPLPGSKGSKWKRRVDGTVERRN